MSLIGRDHEDRFLQDLASLRHCASYELALSQLVTRCVRFFGLRIKVWQVTSDTLIEGLERDPPIADTDTFSPFNIDVAALLNGKSFAWLLNKQGRALLLKVEVPEQRAIYFYVPAGVAKYESSFLQVLCTQISGVLSGLRFAELNERKSKLLELINSATRVALEGEELDDVLRQIAHFLRIQFDFALVSLNTIDCEHWRMVLRAFSVRAEFQAPVSDSTLDLADSDIAPTACIELREGQAWSANEGITGRAFRHAEPQLVNDVSADPDYLAHIISVRSEYALPILRRGQVLGVLNLESDRVGTFDGYTQIALRTLADQLAGAIHLATVNAQLKTNLRVIADREAALQRVNSRLRRANENLRKLSMLDGLTGIANRRAFEHALRRSWRECERSGAPIALAMGDLDHFKRYNDAHGHLAGDDALKTVAQRLHRGLRAFPGALLARYGGEEFALLMPGFDADRARLVTERGRIAVASLLLSSDDAIVTLSAGIASVLPGEGMSADSLILAADLALYQAKANGRNQVCLA
jgi:diguanylate cyclase (GGDEF)-like protein